MEEELATFKWAHEREVLELQQVHGILYYTFQYVQYMYVYRRIQYTLYKYAVIFCYSSRDDKRGNKTHLTFSLPEKISNRA